MKKSLLFSILLFASLFGFANPPPAKEVFQIAVKPIDPNTLAIEWKIKKGYFLYKNRINLNETANTNVHVGSIRFPVALKKVDAQGNNILIYRHHLTLPVAILGELAGETLLNVHYQGCADDGFCYPPETRQIKLTIDEHLALTYATLENQSETPPVEETTLGEHNALDQLFSTNNWAIIILSFFGFGLLLSFTPCVLPMVPVLSGIIVGHSATMSTRKAFFLSLSYVLSMSVTYAIIGAVVALMGNNLQILMQSPWAISFFSLTFVLLALSMFNFYELQLPVSWQAKLANVTRSHSGGHYLGAALMGSLSILILSPCVTAPLIGALGYIANSGNLVLGSLALFFLGLGMGTPLLLIGISAGKLLPRAGRWMNAVKTLFGVMLLAVAIDLMGRLLPAPLTMVLWASLLVFLGIYLGALTKSYSKLEKFRQGLGLIFLMYGLLVLIGASQGNSNPLLPLVSKKSYEKNNENIIVVKTVAEVEEALANARGKPVMMDFYADWCTSCKVIEATTLRNEQVRVKLNEVIVLKVDITANNADSKALLNHFNVVAPPTFLFFDTEGKELTKLRIVGEASTQAFDSHLNTILERD